MFQNKQVRVIFLIMVLVFSVTFYFGVFANPEFNIHDFCMNLASEILGLVIAVVLVETYTSKRRK